jgi:hypothetical protein
LGGIQRLLAHAHDEKMKMTASRGPLGIAGLLASANGHPRNGGADLVYIAWYTEEMPTTFAKS